MSEGRDEAGRDGTDEPPATEARPSATPEPPAAPRSATARWAIALGCVLAYGLATLVPLPGVDQGALAAMAGSRGGLLGLFDVSLPLVAPFGGMLVALALVRGLLRALAPEPARGSRWIAAGGFALFVLLAAGRGYGMALYLESAALDMVDLVARPGLAFRLVAVASYAGAAAITWQLASWISRTGVAQGPLLLLGASLIVDHVARGLDLGPAIARGELAPLGALLHVARVAPLVIVLGALAWRRPSSWPLRLARGLVLTGPADLLVFPYLAGMALSSVLLLGPGLALEGGRLSTGLLLVALLLEVGLAGAVVAWLGRVAHGAGGRGAIVGAVLVLPLALGVVVAGSLLQASAGGSSFWASFTGPAGPFAGEEAHRVELVGLDGAHADHDGPLLERRLHELGVSARVTGRASRLSIELEDVREVDVLLGAVLARRELTLRLVAEDQAGLVPDEGQELPAGLRQGLEQAGLTSARAVSGSTAESLEPWIGRSGVARDEVGIECSEPDEGRGEARCIAWRLEPAVLTGADVAEALVTMDPMDGLPRVSLELTAAAGERFADVTGRSIHRRLAIVLDGRIVSAPVIQSRIGGGRAQITMGRGRAEQVHRDAHALVAALRSGALRTAWRVQSRSRVR